jgi:cell division protein FtsL
MAQKTEIRYIQFYADGSAARQVELPLEPQKRAPQPRRRKHKKIILHVDFVAMAGIVVAAIMLILMMAGMSELSAINEEVTRLESCVAQLENEKIQLQNTYRESYDLEEIRLEAQAMGLVPADQVRTVPVPLQHIVLEEQPADYSFWTFLTGLFA